MEINRGELGLIKRKIILLEKQLGLYRKQNTKLINKIADLLANQKHYLKNKGDRMMLLRKYARGLGELIALKKRLTQFLEITTLPKFGKSRGRTFYLRVTWAEARKLYAMLNSNAVLNSQKKYSLQEDESNDLGQDHIPDHKILLSDPKKVETEKEPKPSQGQLTLEQLSARVRRGESLLE